MKITRTILLGLLVTLFQSNAVAKSYHIICVSGPLETIENDFIKQKLFIGLFKKLIKERNKIASRQNIITFESIGDDNFNKYDTEKLTYKLIDKMYKNKDKDVILMSIGSGNEVIEEAVATFRSSNKVIFNSWQKLIGENLIEKLGLSIDNDDFEIVLDVLEDITLSYTQDETANYYLNIDLEKIEDTLSPLVDQIDELASMCCKPKTKKLVATVAGTVGTAAIIILLAVL
jgi:hypothetical protein